MKVKINGKPETIDQAMNLSELILIKNLDLNKIVIEHNSEIIDKKDLSDISVKEGDNIEIVSFVGGG